MTKDERKCSYLYPSKALKTIRQGGILHTNFPFSFLIELWPHELAQLKPASRLLPPSHSLITLPLPPFISPSRAGKQSNHLVAKQAHFPALNICLPRGRGSLYVLRNDPIALVSTICTAYLETCASGRAHRCHRRESHRMSRRTVPCQTQPPRTDRPNPCTREAIRPMRTTACWAGLTLISFPDMRDCQTGW